jgi:GxxExxY protein
MTTIPITTRSTEDDKSFALDRRVIIAAITVHKTLGPGFLESVYEQALCFELADRGIAFERQHEIAIDYNGRLAGTHRLDLLIERSLILELKTVRTFEARHFAVVRSYMQAAGLIDALLLNFANVTLQTKRVYPQQGRVAVGSNFLPPRWRRVIPPGLTVEIPQCSLRWNNSASLSVWDFGKGGLGLTPTASPVIRATHPGVKVPPPVAVLLHRRR